MIKAIKTALWEIIRAEGIEVTNQNIDWLLERAWKSAQVTDAPSAKMSREKQIEEMHLTESEILANDIAQMCPDLVNSGCGDLSCVTCLSKGLEQIGYRKASEVAREIIDKIDDALHNMAMEYHNAGHPEYFAVCEMVHHKVIAPIQKEYAEGEG